MASNCLASMAMANNISAFDWIIFLNAQWMLALKHKYSQSSRLVETLKIRKLDPFRTLITNHDVEGLIAKFDNFPSRYVVKSYIVSYLKGNFCHCKWKISKWTPKKNHLQQKMKNIPTVIKDKLRINPFMPGGQYINHLFFNFPSLKKIN